MNATRSVIWMVGLVAILAGAYLLYFEAGLDRWISLGLLGAGFLLFVGLAVMAFANSAPNDPAPRVVREEGTVVERVVERAPRTVVERDDTVTRRR